MGGVVDNENSKKKTRLAGNGFPLRRVSISGQCKCIIEALNVSFQEVEPVL
jgi:hypothetical protein